MMNKLKLFFRNVWIREPLTGHLIWTKNLYIDDLTTTGLLVGGGFFIPIRRFSVVGGKQSRGKSWFLAHGKKGFYDGGITL